jgi:NADPH-dependent 2,4-dienoyl-CoA reductase/sulfur reductase-like enzyme
MSTLPLGTSQGQPPAETIFYNESPRARDDSVLGEHPVCPDLDYDAVIVGAGLSGILSLHHLREIGMRARVLEAGSAEGGTWFW